MASVTRSVTASVLSMDDFNKTINRIKKSLVEEINTKLNQFLDKAERNRITLGLGGCSRYSRVVWEYRYFIEFYDNKIDGDTSEKIQLLERLFPNGIVVILRNSDYFTIKDSSVEINKVLVSRLGSDKVLSVVILIESEYSSVTDELEKLAKQLEECEHLQPLYKVPRSSAQGNSSWEGHYCINLKGGKQDKSVKGKIPLGNDIYDYADKQTVRDVTIKLIYEMLHCVNAVNLLKEENPDELINIKDELREIIVSLNIPLHDNIKYGVLRCCISNIEIKSSDFLEKKIDLCHLSPKSYTDVIIDNGRVFTSYKSSNISWGLTHYNRMQGNMSKECFMRQMFDFVKHNEEAYTAFCQSSENKHE